MDKGSGYNSVKNPENTDISSRWFHLECVDLDKKPIPDVWYCPYCTKARKGFVKETK